MENKTTQVCPKCNTNINVSMFSEKEVTMCTNWKCRKVLMFISGKLIPLNLKLFEKPKLDLTNGEKVLLKMQESRYHQ